MKPPFRTPVIAGALLPTGSDNLQIDTGMLWDYHRTLWILECLHLCTYTLEPGTPARDRTGWDRPRDRDRTKPSSHRSRTWASSWRLALIAWWRRMKRNCVRDCLSFYLQFWYLCLYLYAGTGNPCAGQNRVRSSPRTRWYQASFASLENLGFFVATGSDRVTGKEMKFSLHAVRQIWRFR